MLKYGYYSEMGKFIIYIEITDKWDILKRKGGKVAKVSLYKSLMAYLLEGVLSVVPIEEIEDEGHLDVILTTNVERDGGWPISEQLHEHVTCVQHRHGHVNL